jgi:hypothetical protein
MVCRYFKLISYVLPGAADGANLFRPTAAPPEELRRSAILSGNSFALGERWHHKRAATIRR